MNNLDDQSDVKETQEPKRALNEVPSNEAPRVSERLRPQRALNEVKAHETLRLSEQLRPLRLLPVGKEAVWTKADADFLKFAREENLQISYVENPKSKGSASRLRYHRYCRPRDTCVKQSVVAGATTG